MKAVPLAERAALGSLLLPINNTDDTSGQSQSPFDVARWLRAEDFADPWHREVYASIRALSTVGDPAGAEDVGQYLLRRLGPTRAAVVRIAALLREAPTGSHAGTYGAMVLEASLRREAVAQGVVLRAGALQSTLEGSPRPMTAVAALVDSTLDAAAGRWAAATSHEPVTTGRNGTAPLPLLISAAKVDAALSADRLLAAHPAPAAGEVAEHEATLIAALLTHPEQLHATACWLRPAAVTNRAWRPVYDAMLRLHTHGHPIDPVTVLWETQRASRAAGPGPDPATVTAKAESAFASHPGHWARVVAADHLRTTADRAAESLRAAAANPGLEVAEVLGTGHILTAALSSAAQPLGGPTGDGRRLASVHPLPAHHLDRVGPVAG